MSKIFALVRRIAQIDAGYRASDATTSGEKYCSPKAGFAWNKDIVVFIL